MNLLFVTVEIERNGMSDQPLSERTRYESQVRRSPLLLVGLALVVLIRAATAGFAGWVVAGGDPLVAAVFDWSAVNSDSGMDDRAALQITSQPDGATVLVDGRQKGRTPLLLAVSKTTHTLLVKHPEAVDEQRQVTVSTDMNVSVNMWRRRPNAVQLRPTYPGARP